MDTGQTQGISAEQQRVLDYLQERTGNRNGEPVGMDELGSHFGWGGQELNQNIDALKSAGMVEQWTPSSGRLAGQTCFRATAQQPAGAGGSGR